MLMRYRVCGNMATQLDNLLIGRINTSSQQSAGCLEILQNAQATTHGMHLQQRLLSVCSATGPNTRAKHKS